MKDESPSRPVINILQAFPNHQGPVYQHNILCYSHKCAQLLNEYIFVGNTTGVIVAVQS